MSHPSDSAHADPHVTEDPRPLPVGWTKRFSPTQHAWYYIDIHDPDHPHSQWTFPGDHPGGGSKTHPKVDDDGPSWLEAGGMGVAGAALGAFAEHEWEKRKRKESFEKGVHKAQSDAAKKEKFLQAELDHVKRENARLHQEQYKHAYQTPHQHSTAYPHQPSTYAPPAGWGGSLGSEWEDTREPTPPSGAFAGDGRLGPYY